MAVTIQVARRYSAFIGMQPGRPDVLPRTGAS
jgi:hypothetical protein